MNWDEIQLDWCEKKMLIQTYWKRLSPEDVDKIDGCRDKLSVLLQARYGLSKEEAGEEINGFEKDVRYPGAVK